MAITIFDGYSPSSSTWNNAYRLRLLVEWQSYDALSNSSQVRFRLILYANGSQWFDQWAVTGNIDYAAFNAAGTKGSTVSVWNSPSGNQTQGSAGADKTWADKTMTIVHDTNGLLRLGVFGDFKTNTAPSTTYPYLVPYMSIGSVSSINTSSIDEAIPAVAATISISREAGTSNIVVSRNTPTSSTSAAQTFTTYLSKNGGAYSSIGTGSSITVTSSPTDYASAYVISSFDGDTAQSSTVTIYGVPFAPSAPTISNVVTTNLTLSWTAPGTNGSPITSYIVQATTNNGATWTDLYTGVTTTTQDVTGLTIAATYKFRIIAVSVLGNSASGAESSAQFISAYGYRFTSPTVKTAVVSAARYTGSQSDSIVLNGVTYTGWKQIANVKKYTNGIWGPLER